MKGAVFFSLLMAFLSGCTAKSGVGTRYEESAVMAAPSLSVNLPHPDQFTFAIVGDLHIGTDTARFSRILTQSKGEGDAFIILLGDIVDKGEVKSFTALTQALAAVSMQNAFLPVIGNHDVFDEGWLHYKTVFGASHYAITVGNCRFIALDTADGTVGEDQFHWLEEELSKPSVTHTFLLSHYLPTIPGQRTYLRLANEMEALKLMKLAERTSVRAWLGAHYHSYIHERIENVDYIVAGGGGGRRMEPVKENFYVQIQVTPTQVSDTLKIID